MAEPVKQIRQEGLRILVVGADPFILQETVPCLLAAGYLVETAESAEQALEKADTFHPQMLLADGTMDGADGVDLCQTLRQRKNGHLLYIILLTSRDGEDSLAGAFEGSGDDFISRPLTPRVLLARVVAGARMVHLQIEVEQARREQAERERLSQQIQQAHKMQAIGKLTGGIAHNFNNLLAAILGYTELAQEMFPGVGEGRLDEFLENIHRAGIEACDLVASLRSFSDGNSDSRQTLLMGVMLNNIMRMLKPILTASIDLKTDFAEKMPPVMVNQEQVYQMVMSLCINAREAMGNSGEICLGLKRVHEQNASCASCHEWVNDDYIELSVSDSGQGIGAETLQRMFDPFYSTKEAGRGTGLGLSVVHGIMHGYGGHILVDSEAGKGSNFRLLFPVSTSRKHCAEADSMGAG